MTRLSEDERAWEAELLMHADVPHDPSSWYAAPIHQPERMELWALRLGRRLRSLLHVR